MIFCSVDSDNELKCDFAVQKIGELICDAHARAKMMRANMEAARKWGMREIGIKWAQLIDRIIQ
jgi:hypothetical protein